MKTTNMGVWLHDLRKGVLAIKWVYTVLGTKVGTGVQET